MARDFFSAFFAGARFAVFFSVERTLAADFLADFLAARFRVVVAAGRMADFRLEAFFVRFAVVAPALPDFPARALATRLRRGRTAGATIKGSDTNPSDGSGV